MTSITPQIRLKPIAASPYTAPTSRPSIMEARMPDMFHPPRSWFSTPAALELGSSGHRIIGSSGALVQNHNSDHPMARSPDDPIFLSGSDTSSRRSCLPVATQLLLPACRTCQIGWFKTTIQITRWPDHPMTRSSSVDRIHQAGALACQWPHNFFYQLAGLVLLPLRQNHGMAYLQAVFVGGGRKLGPPVEGSDIGGVQRLRHLGRVDPARLFDGALQDQPAPVATGGLVAGRRIV